MKVLWITNIIFPAPSKALGISVPVSGGWMMSSLEVLKESLLDMEIAVATIYPGKNFKTLKIDGVSYYLLPSSEPATIYDKTLEPLWQQVRDDFRPDVTHIHGTEYPYGLAYIRACGPDKVCISIQGLVSVIARYYYAGMSVGDILKNITFRDLLKRDTIFRQKNNFEKRGEIEHEYIRSVSHIIGRTSWDRAHVWAINPDIDYHFCNETLRSSFYNHKWESDKCVKHSIFLSQASYPIKGLHKVLQAMPIILRHYPDARVSIAGNNITDKPFYRISGYGKYIRSLIRKYNLQEKVNFLGNLSESRMCEEYLKANVFICPSAIENSPNSLGEAQLLGVPHIASYVGGVMDMMVDAEDNMYRFEEVEMLAEKVCKIFEDGMTSENDVTKRHDRLKNASCLVDIYRYIIGKDGKIGR